MRVIKTEDICNEDYKAVICENSNDLCDIIERMGWDKLSAIKIESELASIEASGSHEDGFSMIYCQGNDEKITPNDPSLGDVIDVLVKFYDGDDSWSENQSWSKEKHQVKDKCDSSEKANFARPVILTCIAVYAFYAAYAGGLEESALPYFAAGLGVFLAWEYLGFYKKVKNKTAKRETRGSSPRVSR